MRAIVKEPGRMPAVRNVSNELRALQDIVGGHIETVTFNPDCCAICNEEGRIRGMAPNFCFCGVDFVGPVIFVGVDGEEFTDLSQVKAAFLIAELTKAEVIARGEWNYED